MSRLDRITDWLERAILAHFDASQLAKMCLVSPSQLRRYFASAFGVTPHDWLTEVRLCQAAHLLCASCLSVKDIARELHFANESHLCHQFKKRFACKPSEFALRYNRQQGREFTRALAKARAPSTLPIPLPREMTKSRLGQKTLTVAVALQKQPQRSRRRL